jgi:glycosyltransferase involved in cell wall biosynthesis
MKILIDATNIISGGGVSHLTELMNATSCDILKENDIEQVFIVGIASTLGRIKDEPWIIKIGMGRFEDSLLRRQYWKLRNLNNIIKHHGIDLVFNPGGAYISFRNKVKYVTMCRNMLVFEKEEADRFGFTLFRLKFSLLKIMQTQSMKNASGVIFISEYAKAYITNKSKIKINNSIVIYHGVNDRFSMAVKPQKPIQLFNFTKPFSILYVSNIDLYKHQDTIAKAIVKLIEEKKYPIKMTFVGKKERGQTKLQNIIDGYGHYFDVFDKVTFEQIHEFYSSSDLFVFASTCENMPNILIEAMNSGLPIACSKKQPMPEFLRDGGAYFDALDSSSAENVIEELLLSPDKREKMAIRSKEYSSKFDWRKCSIETFKFLKECC